ncbi:polysaccharide biosynthesis/export family protein [Ramlibacter sp.]|uniref:polysaccharide biosynthesis/export family protein n=1 Tax=Ramlibacter sp. TaxID=1917967 RepID=UPI002FC5DF1D
MRPNALPVIVALLLHFAAGAQGSPQDLQRLLQQQTRDSASSAVSPRRLPSAAANQPQSLYPSSSRPGVSNEAPVQPASASEPTTIKTSAPAATAAAASEVFGAQLFTGTFAQQGPTLFNPDYLIATGDTVQVRLWGAFDFNAPLVVDPQGNIFLPNVGPVQVRGVRNAQLQPAVETAVRRVYRANVFSYASLAEAQPVRVFVSGFVVRPGLYGGTSMDSLLHYLDQAGGIDPERGTFLEVQVQRNGLLRGKVNLYDFLLQGRIPSIQLATGDVIFVPARQGTVKVAGLAANPKRFEFSGPSRNVADLIALARPLAAATHVRVVRNTGTVRNTEYYALSAASTVTLIDGDELEFTADKKPGTITVRVEGEHQSPQEYVLPYGARLGDLLKRVEFNDRSEQQNVQLFRQSVKQRQREMLDASLRSLETALLTARSGSSDEARLRTDEANLTLQWVERARSIEPLGQVLVAQNANKGDLLLENGDIIRIPTRDGLVLVSGEVLFPNAVAHESSLGLQDYIQRAGGFTQNADNSRVVVARRDGSFLQADASKLSNGPMVNPGDQVLVLPKVDEKNRQFALDITKILSQIAITAGVVFGL